MTEQLGITYSFIAFFVAFHIAVGVAAIFVPALRWPLLAVTAAMTALALLLFKLYYDGKEGKI